MHKEFLMGNEAIALGAIAAGVNVVSGYPGTPSTEVLETVSKRNPGDIYVEWSINEKSAMEVAAGAAYTGARALVTMKQVGLNVASDPLMSLEYIGVKGGMVVLVADDPGPISSQTEQDTRTFGMYSKLPVFDPSSVEEAYEMIQEAFEYSEKYKTPVFLRPTTRIDHAYQSILVKDSSEYKKTDIEGFVKDSSKWVIFPRLSVVNHAKIEERNDSLKDVFSDYDKNKIIPETGSFEGVKLGICSQGISFSNISDIYKGKDNPRILKVATPFPFPEKLALSFMEGLDEILVIEELDPVLERALIFTAGKYGINIKISGKLNSKLKRSGEYDIDEIKNALNLFFKDVKKDDNDNALISNNSDYSDMPSLPVRPPVLCAGCPHRASFYAVKEAMKGEKTIYCGDIGCYTLGNAKPLDMCDTCLCMGAGINIGQGVWHVEKDTKAFAFVGDSTFFASGITGAVNGFYNQADLTLCILDNSTTAMTGHQPHPGTGYTMMGEVVSKVDIKKVLNGIGITTVEEVNPLEHKKAVDTVKRVADMEGVKAIIFKYPCIVKFKPNLTHSHINESKCINCKKCINELGCPGIIIKNGRPCIDDSLCTGCTLCEQICPVGAIEGGRAGDPKRFMDEGITPKKPAKKPVNVETKKEPVENQKSNVNKSIVMSGVGGQGTILASKILAYTAMNNNIPVKSAETIGMAQRGGSVFSFLKLGDNNSPMIAKNSADIIIGFEPAEAVRLLPYLKKGGTVVTSTLPVIPVTAMIGACKYDTDEVINYLKEKTDNLILIDSKKALEDLQNDKVLNVLLLGAAVSSGELGIDKNMLKESIKNMLPEKLHEVNLKALDYEI
ncbi:MAG: indolepyruvate ferredoxin oxidoreductase subunit alpha [Lachnospiraceae bacterium]|nr:indolepyruvate ferredoxin oxidoreductase subunit alpha [Lachnospiraceae bacterium]